jgi:hypothetical protein
MENPLIHHVVDPHISRMQDGLKHQATGQGGSIRRCSWRGLLGNMERMLIGWTDPTRDGDALAVDMSLRQTRPAKGDACGGHASCSTPRSFGLRERPRPHLFADLLSSSAGLSTVCSRHGSRDRLALAGLMTASLRHGLLITAFVS